MSIKYYDENAKEFYENTITADMSELYQEFISLLPQGARILDLGCGSGRDSLFFLKAGFDVVAVDASQKLVELATALIGKPVLHTTFQELNFANEFDGVWACASLLHVPKVQMQDVLDKVHKALKADGLLYCSFKYGVGESERNGRFFNSYDEASFMDLIERHGGFTIKKLWRTADVRPDRGEEYWLNCLVKKAC